MKGIILPIEAKQRMISALDSLKTGEARNLLQ